MLDTWPYTMILIARGGSTIRIIVTPTWRIFCNLDGWVLLSLVMLSSKDIRR